MTDPIPTVQPTEKSCCGGSMLPFLAGLVIGAGVVGAGATVFIRHQQSAHQRALAEAAVDQATAGRAALQAGQFMQGAIGNALNMAGNPVPAAVKADAPGGVDQDKIKKLGDDAVDDLRQGRALLVYRHLSPDLKKKMTLEEFEKKNVDTVSVPIIMPLINQRVTRVMKATDGAGYEYYCTSAVYTNTGTVNFAFTFVPADGDWQISDVQVKYKPNP